MQAFQPRYLVIFFLLLGVTACYRKDIEFGDDPENNYTRIVQIDTVAVKLATVITDSFATSNATTMLLGNYADPFLGVVSAMPYFRLQEPALPDIPASAVFDSLVFIIRPNKYYYGDTGISQTIEVHELSQNIGYSYNDLIYNTTVTAVKPVPLGSRNVRIRPSVDDSVMIKLDPAKGAELFEKIRLRSPEVSTADNFLNYFKGIRLSVNSNDKSAVYGLDAADTMTLRVMYHHTLPTEQKKHIDLMANLNVYAYNQLVTDRTGTSLPVSSTGITVVPSAQTGNVAFTQYGTGLLLKMTFPSLRNILKTDNITKILNAELIVRPDRQSFDRYLYRLPSSLYLAVTNASNRIGEALVDSTGSRQNAAPQIDFIHGENTHYRFNVTSYIAELLALQGTEEYGFFLMEDRGSGATQVNRAVINDATKGKYRTELKLTFLVINN